MMPPLARLAAAAILSTAVLAGVAVEARAQTQPQTQPQIQPQIQPQTGTELRAPARVIGGPLANVNVVQMSVAPLSDQAHVCGLQDDLILDSFRQPLTEAGITILPAAHVWIQLQATTIRYEGDICISYIEARALLNTRYFDRNSETERSGRVLLWSDAGLFVTGIANHGVTTNIGWRDLARSFIRKWKMDQ